LHSIWVFVTDCGDGAVTLPLALLTLVFLFAARQHRMALAWTLTIGGCAAAIGVLKLVFGACSHRLTMLQIHSPSGHTAMSTAIYGSLALLIGASLPPHPRWAVRWAAALLIAAIAGSRLVLREHVLPEIEIGLIVGLAAIAGFRAMQQRWPSPVLPIGWLAVGGGAIIAVMHGTRWMVEPAVHDLSVLFRLILPWCV
jgi:membrane-associated phospholipid phosphatase